MSSFSSELESQPTGDSNLAASKEFIFHSIEAGARFLGQERLSRQRQSTSKPSMDRDTMIDRGILELPTIDLLECLLLRKSV